MADQVNPMGSLAPSLNLVLLATPASQPGQEKPRAAKAADPKPTRAADGRLDMSAKALDSAVQEFKDFLQQAQSDLLFKVDESSGRIYFKIVDAATKEVIRQVPSEEILAMARKLREMVNPKDAPGVLVDEEG